MALEAARAAISGTFGITGSLFRVGASFPWNLCICDDGLVLSWRPES